MKYKVVRENSVKELMEAVQVLLEDGWDLHGNLVVITDSRVPSMIYFREMVKFEEGDNASWEIVTGASMSTEDVEGLIEKEFKGLLHNAN